jgi:hypothetical protein
MQTQISRQKSSPRSATDSGRSWRSSRDPLAACCVYRTQWRHQLIGASPISVRTRLAANGSPMTIKIVVQKSEEGGY